MKTISRVCEKCSTVETRNFVDGVSGREQTVYCRGCTNVYDIVVVDYAVESTLISGRSQVAKRSVKGGPAIASRKAYYEELNKAWVPGSQASNA